MEIFPAKLQKLWNALELRVLVLLSLFLQIVLISTGYRRKYTTNKLVTIILWLSYLSADAIATISLGVLSQAQTKADQSVVDPSYTITAFWAPFLLMHLGGQDTITAYALADNELWSRHLLGLVSQVGVAIYIFLRSWSGTPLNYLWIVIFVAGLVKYGERTCALFSASKGRFRELMIALLAPLQPNYAKFMNEFVRRKREGHEVSIGRAITISSSSPAQYLPATNVAYGGEGIQDGIVLQKAYSFFEIVRKLFADFTLSFQDSEASLSFFLDSDMTWDKAFSIIEIELGLIYDLFYTKVFLLHSSLGIFLRILSCSFTITAFITFLVINKNVYPKTEVVITYILLVGAISIEIYAIMILVSSDKMMIWLSGNTQPKLIRKFKKPIVSTICKIVSLLRYLHIAPAGRRWSNAMGQHNVLNSGLQSRQKCINILQYLEKYLFWSSVSIPIGLKVLIFDELKLRIISGVSDEKSGSHRRDEILLKEMNYFGEGDEDHAVTFDTSILLWHMARDLCYYTDADEEHKPDETWLYEFIVNDSSSLEDNLKFKCEISKILSDYMVHLLISSSLIVLSGVGEIQFQGTCAEAIEFFNEQKLWGRHACRKLLQVDTGLVPCKVKGDRSKSLLFDACRLAKSLKSLEVGERWDKITQAWLDILTFAASQCGWSDHAERLSQGGELLTHVRLLMAHFGLTDQVKARSGFARAILNLN